MNVDRQSLALIILYIIFSPEPREDIMENCPKCDQISSYNGPDFYWE
jgi:hypothetical protein